jgi:hypothetical protein
MERSIVWVLQTNFSCAKQTTGKFPIITVSAVGTKLNVRTHRIFVTLKNSVDLVMTKNFAIRLELIALKQLLHIEERRMRQFVSFSVGKLKKDTISPWKMLMPFRQQRRRYRIRQPK